jgi:hypothetical protein
MGAELGLGTGGAAMVEAGAGSMFSLHPVVPTSSEALNKGAKRRAKDRSEKRPQARSFIPAV